jgi:hypothetical protein
VFNEGYVFDPFALTWAKVPFKGEKFYAKDSFSIVNFDSNKFLKIGGFNFESLNELTVLEVNGM